jgi:hypothetical protein
MKNHPPGEPEGRTAHAANIVSDMWKSARSRMRRPTTDDRGCDGSLGYCSRPTHATTSAPPPKKQRPANAETTLVTRQDEAFDPEIAFLSELLGVVAAGVLAMLIWLF